MNEMETLPTRIFKRIMFEPNTGCWLWTGYCNHRGYGKLHPVRKGGSTYAHHIVYEHFMGVIPDGLEPDHLCRIHACVNPGHLEPVTHLENMRRGHYAIATHCKRGHEYTAENTIRNGGGRWRRCRACHYWRGSEYRAGRRAKAVPKYGSADGPVC